MMNKRKYQIFISSTYMDLKKVRREISKVILNMGQIPVGMEQFPAASVEQFEYIKKQLDDCDYMVLVIGNRYGSICEETALSYIEMEYDYAVKNNIPVLTFICRNPKSSKNCDNVDALNKFIKKVSKKLCCICKKTELPSRVIQSINQAIDDYKRPGWVRENNTEQLIKNMTNDSIISYYPQVITNTNDNWYEKYESGKIRQGGRIKLSDNKRFLTFLTPFRANKYTISLESIDKNLKIYARQATTTSLQICCDELKKDETVDVSWLVEGF